VVRGPGPAHHRRGYHRPGHRRPDRQGRHWNAIQTPTHPADS